MFFKQNGNFLRFCLSFHNPPQLLFLALLAQIIALQFIGRSSFTVRIYTYYERLYSFLFKFFLLTTYPEEMDCALLDVYPVLQGVQFVGSCYISILAWKCIKQNFKNQMPQKPTIRNNKHSKVIVAVVTFKL